MADPQLATSIDVSPFDRRAAIAPSSADDTARTVELTFSTGAPVERYDWLSGKRYIEKLSMDPSAIRMDRLNAGAPLLDTHAAWSVRDMLGAVVPGTAEVKGKSARALVQFSKRAEVDPVWRDVQDGLLRNVSVGYRVYAFEEMTPKGGGLPVRTATDWEPFEISMVPMPADAGAQTRDAKDATWRTNPCIVTTRAEAAPPQERIMTENELPESLAERELPEPEVTRANEPAQPSDAELATRAERERVDGIMNACLASQMSIEFQQRLIRDGIPLVKAQALIFEEMKKRGGDARGPKLTQVRVGDDQTAIHSRAGITGALLHRVNPKWFPLDDVSRTYRGMTLMDMAETFLKSRGVRWTDAPKMQRAAMALGLDTRGGMQSSSDFANLLADVSNKVLRKAYDESPATFEPIVRRRTVPDFKNINVVQLGDAPALTEVKQHGEFTRGKVLDGKEYYYLKTYGKVFAITRQALVNDDTNAFSRIPTLFGASARRLEADLVYAQLTGNPTMGDGNALFSAAHNNLETDGDHIAIASLDRGRQSMRKQTGLDGATVLDIVARFLLVPAALETKAQQFTAQITPSVATSVNPFQNLTVIAEPRLDANSVTAWYLVASPDQIDTIELASLEGESGPQLESRVGFDVDGLEVKCRMDAAAKAIDWRGFHKDPGDLDS